MLRHIRWQLALALAGLVVVAGVLLVLSQRSLEPRPARGGQLVQAVSGRVAVLNPLFATTDAEIDVSRLLFGGLTQTGTDGLVRPQLATRWQVSDDARAYTFTLRTDALWHDGRPLTAEDVVFTARVARRLAEDPSFEDELYVLVPPWARARAEALDPQTVVITLDQPHAPFLEATGLGILPAHLLDGVEDPGRLRRHRFSTVAPTGSGPYRLATPGGIEDGVVRLERFDDHWAATERRPYIERLVLRTYDTSLAALEALGQRTVQGMSDVPAGAFESLGERTRYYTSIRPGYALVYLNTEDPLFEDAAMRRALSLAVDRNTIISDPALLNGQGIIAASPIAPGSWAHDGSLTPPEHDPEAARALLEERGWIDSLGTGVRDRDGKPLSFELAAPNDPLLVAIAQQLRDDWAAVGVDVTVRSFDRSPALENLRQRAFDAMLYAWDRRTYDPDPYALWHSSQATAGHNYAGWRNSDADALIRAARETPPEDIARRRELYVAFQQLFATEQPALMLYHPTYTFAVADPAVGGVQLPQLLAVPADRFLTLERWFVRTERRFGAPDDDA